MELFWYILIAILVAVFFVLDGYDFGAGIIQLFFAKSKKDKELITKSAGLYWDFNEVWLVAAGGLLFMAFPKYYASFFSGFYLPLIIVLWLIIFRAIGLEFKGQFNNSMWKSIWDASFGVSSLLLALFFGVALGNVVRGVNLGGVVDGVSAYEAHYFFLPLWNSSFSPEDVHPGVLDWFTVLIGLISVVLLTIHGANWIVLKTNASINNKLKSYVFSLNIVLIILTFISLSIWHLINDNPFANYIAYPILMIFPLVFIGGIIGLFFVKKYKDELYAFVCSSIVIVGGITSTIVSIFPKILPSTNNVNESLTIYNTNAQDYGLSVAIYWIIIGLLLIIVYIIFQKRILSGKLDDIDYGH